MAVDDGFSRTNRTAFDVWQKYTKNSIDIKLTGEIDTDLSPEEIFVKKLEIMLSKELKLPKVYEAMSFVSILKTPSLSEKMKEVRWCF